MNEPSNPQSPCYVTCRCRHCDIGIEFDANELADENSIIVCPHCGLETKLCVPEKNELPIIYIPPAPVAPLKQKRKVASCLAKLTEETIRVRIKNGDTPLHRAAKNGKIHEIPKHLLRAELFLAKSNCGETPMHLAARHGHLDQIPSEYLTKETLTTSKEYETPKSIARTETPLHIAVGCGHAEQIPKKFFTPEFLSIRASGYQTTLLHCLAYANRLDLVPEIYANSEIWNLTDYIGQTPRQVLEGKIHRDNYVARVRSEPATEKQKEKLRFFGCTWNNEITKGQAADAIDECVSRFPKINTAYYNRPATEEQRAELRSYGVDPDEDPDEEGEPLTYGKAKDWLLDCRLEERVKHEEKMSAEIEEMAKEMAKTRWH